MVSRLQSAGRLIERAQDNREYNTRVLVGGLQNKLLAEQRAILHEQYLSRPIKPSALVNREQSPGNCINVYRRFSQSYCCSYMKVPFFY